VTPNGWRSAIALLASIQAHTLLWAWAFAPDAPTRLLPHASRERHHERFIEVEPFLDTSFTEGQGGDTGLSTWQGQGRTAERRSSAAAIRGKGAKSAKAASLSPAPSLDWLYARVAARASEDTRGQGTGGGPDAEGGGEGAKGDPGLWHTPARVENSDWRACPVSVAFRPAYAHVIADVDAEGHAIAVRLVDADAGTSQAALQCAMDAHYIPSHDAQGNPVRGRTRVFRVEFPL
jgi:hypothetical protein